MCVTTSCGLKHVTWDVEVKELLNIERNVLFATSLKGKHVRVMTEVSNTF